jgi:hypothetical protein
MLPGRPSRRNRPVLRPVLLKRLMAPITREHADDEQDGADERNGHP